MTSSLRAPFAVRSVLGGKFAQLRSSTKGPFHEFDMSGSNFTQCSRIASAGRFIDEQSIDCPRDCGAAHSAHLVHDVDALVT